MLYEYRKRTLILCVFIFILFQFLIKQLFHPRLLDMTI